MADVKDFLFKFFAQRHFDLMPADVRARYDTYSKNNDFNGHMKSWTKDFIDTSSTPPANKPLEELTDHADFEALYNLVQSVFQKMHANRKDFKDVKPVNDFLDKWFGKDKLFDYSKATPEAKDDINALLDLLEKNKSRLNIVLRANNVLSDDFSIDKLIDGIKSEKYDSDPEFRDRLLYAIDYVMTYQDRGDPSYWPIQSTITFKEPDTEKWFKVDTSRLGEFKTNYIDILSELVSNKPVRENFTKYDSKNIITKQLNDALKQTGYDDKESKDYVPPLVKEQKNVIDKIKDWKEETYEQYFRKFFSSRGSRKYFSTYAYEIVKAIDKEKIKPTDGIDGIISKKDALLKRFADKSPTTKKHFEWFEQAMSDVKSRVPHSYENAFKDGRKLKQVVSQVIVKAVQENKIDEAKTTLELLSVCKYGFTTSKTMDALKNEGITIFSDEKLSWMQNKNDMVKAIFKSADQALGFTLRAVGRAGATVRNIYQQHLSKFNGVPGELAPYIQEKKAEKQSIILGKKHQDQQMIDINNARLTELDAGLGKSQQQINSSHMPGLQTELNNRKRLMDNAQSALNTAEQNLNNEQSTLQGLEQTLAIKEQIYNESLQDIALLQAQENASSNLKAHQDRLIVLNNELQSLIKGTPEYNIKMQEIADTENEVQRFEQLIDSFKNADPDTLVRLGNARQIRDDYNNAIKAYYDAQKAPIYVGAKQAYDNAKTTFEDTQNSYANLNDDINEYQNLNIENNTLNNNIHGPDGYDHTINNWEDTQVDNYRNLMAYWDTLQTFSKTHSWKLATVKMQKRNLEKETRNINGKDVTQTLAQWQIQSQIDNYRYAS